MSAAGFTSLFLLFLGLSALAASTDTIPAGIDSASVRIGQVTGIEDRYAGDGKLYSLGEYRSVQFTSENLSHFNARAQQLIQALNRFGSQQLGSNINFGVLSVDTKPEVQYYAPVYARGVTDRWTLGFGLPVVHYTNRVSLSQKNSNLQYYRSQLTGVSTELDSALNIDLVKETQATLRERGYRPIEDHDETFLGDVQVASLYRLLGDNWNGLLYSATVGLPTGPQYNPDDLVEMNIFGRTNIDNKLLWSNMLNSHLEVVPYVGYLYYIPDQVTARVPTNEDDVLPDQNSKERVHRQVGNSVSVGGDVIIYLDDQFSFGGGYSMTDKQRDRYTGSEGRRYDLLGQNTDSRYQRVNAQFNYSTVKTYMKKQSLAPTIVSYNYSDTVSGSNVERRTINELTLMMFF